MPSVPPVAIRGGVRRQRHAGHHHRCSSASAAMPRRGTTKASAAQGQRRSSVRLRPPPPGRASPRTELGRRATRRRAHEPETSLLVQRLRPRLCRGSTASTTGPGERASTSRVGGCTPRSARSASVASRQHLLAVRTEAALVTAARWPARSATARRCCFSRPARCGRARGQETRPSGLKATLVTAPLWPENVPIVAPVATSRCGRFRRCFRSRASARRAERERDDVLRVTFQHAESLAGSDVPDRCGVVAAAGDEQAAVGAEGDALDEVPLVEGADEPSRVGVVEPGPAVVADHGDLARVGAEQDVRRREGESVPPRKAVVAERPDCHCPAGDGRHSRCGRVEHGAPHGALEPEGVQQASVGEPDPDPPVRAGGEDERPVR